MATKTQRFRAYDADGNVEASGTLTSGKATIKPVSADVVRIVFFTGKLAEESVTGALEVRIPVGASSEVTIE